MASEAARRHPGAPAWATELLVEIGELRTDVRHLVAATRREERLMADLNTAVADLTAAVSSEADAVNSAATELSALAAQVAALPDGQAIADQIETQVSGLQASTQALSDATTAAETPPAPPAPSA